MARGEGGGRPSKFTKEIKKQIKFLALKGFTEQEMADALLIDRSTLTKWKQKNPKFFTTLKDWKAEADSKVEKSLFERAQGFTTTETKTISGKDGEEGQTIVTEKQNPPDSTACIFWLKNRKSKEWRDKIEHGGDLNLTIKRKTYKNEEME